MHPVSRVRPPAQCRGRHGQVPAGDVGGMRVLVVTGRMPADSGKGDQLRGFQFARALAIDHEVEVVTTGAGKTVTDAEVRIAEFATLRVLHTPPPARAMGAIGALLRGQPAQVGWMMPG